MEEYIHELLLENETVIIPGFGAFISTYKPAEFSEGNDEIKPPSKIISFNEQIRNNDGLLVGYVAELKKISHFDALIKIEKERENILYKLDSGEKVILKGTGTLCYSDNHEIDFTPEVEDNLLLDSFGLETTAISAIEIEKQTEKSASSPEGINVKPVTDDDKPHKKTNKPDVSKEETTKNILPGDNRENHQKEQAPNEQKKKKMAWWWYLIILFPLLAVSVFILTKGMHNGTPAQKEQQTSSITITESPEIISEQDSTQSDSTDIKKVDTTTIKIPEPELAIQTKSQEPKYYLVSGSFSVQENAETYLRELKAKGINAFHAGRKGKFYCIGIAIYDSFEEAENAKKERMNNNPDIELWVWKK